MNDSNRKDLHDTVKKMREEVEKMRAAHPDMPKWNPQFRYKLLPVDTLIIAFCVAMAALDFAGEGGAWIWMLATGANIAVAGFNAQMLGWWRREAHDWKYLSEVAHKAIDAANAQFEDMFTTMRKARDILDKQPDNPEAKEVADYIRSKMGE